MILAVALLVSLAGCERIDEKPSRVEPAHEIVPARETLSVVPREIPLIQTGGRELPQTGNLAFGEVNYRYFIYDSETQEAGMVWKKGDKSYRSLNRVRKELGKKLLFATNGGMYMEDGAPLGLYIEEGREMRPLITKTKGYGNFYLQPNGVFYLKENGQPGLSVTAKFDPREIKFATQSGPMLLSGGKMNLNFTEGSTHTHIRSGVGITPEGQAVFVISDQLVNFYDFARFFQEEFACRDALYLDGFVSRMYLRDLPPLEMGGDFGAIIVITEKDSPNS